jgi:hypothetical protein
MLEDIYIYIRTLDVILHKSRKRHAPMSNCSILSSGRMSGSVTLLTLSVELGEAAISADAVEFRNYATLLFSVGAAECQN